MPERTQGDEATEGETGKRGGGAGRSRTDLHGFAIRCITALLPRLRGLTTQGRKREACASLFLFFGAGNEARTRDLNLGKVALYQLSYSRVIKHVLIERPVIIN